MILILELPDDIAEALASCRDLSRRIFEALAIDGYRHELLTQFQVGRLLRLSRGESENFLAQHLDLYSYDPSELHRKAETLKEYSDRLSDAFS